MNDKKGSFSGEGGKREDTAGKWKQGRWVKKSGGTKRILQCDTGDAGDDMCAVEKEM